MNRHQFEISPLGTLGMPLSYDRDVTTPGTKTVAGVGAMLATVKADKMAWTRTDDAVWKRRKIVRFVVTEWSPAGVALATFNFDSNGHQVRSGN